MKGYRFIADKDTKRGVMRCGQAVIKNVPKKKYLKKLIFLNIKKPQSNYPGV